MPPSRVDGSWPSTQQLLPVHPEAAPTPLQIAIVANSAGRSWHKFLLGQPERREYASLIPMYQGADRRQESATEYFRIEGTYLGILIRGRDVFCACSAPLS
jgi:hypothetical protein